MINPITSQPEVAAEVRESNDIGSTIQSLSSIIERNAIHLAEVKEKIKQERESLKSVLENDSEYSEAEEQAKNVRNEVKAQKARVMATPVAAQTKIKISELTEEKKEIEESLSNHLVNYHSMTNSNSFDTSDGDQWEFSIKAKVKSRQLKLFE